MVVLRTKYFLSIANGTDIGSNLSQRVIQEMSDIWDERQTMIVVDH